MTEVGSVLGGGLESDDLGDDGGSGGKGVLTSGVKLSHNLSTFESPSVGGGESRDEMVQVGEEDKDEREGDVPTAHNASVSGRERGEWTTGFDDEEVGDRPGWTGSCVGMEEGFEKGIVFDSERGGLDNGGTIMKTDRHQRQARPKPGVILLGRGNSFSLGRSEVILLHNRPKAKSSRNRKSENSGVGNDRDEKLVTIEESRASVGSDDVLGSNMTEGGDYRFQTIPSSSPPPVSNGSFHPDWQQKESDSDAGSVCSSDGVIQLVPCYQDDLHGLWLKAESTMTRRNDKVRKILEEFGIGEPGGGGGEDENFWEEEDLEDRRKEEEEVWQMIQGR